MRRSPHRRFLFHVAETLGKSVKWVEDNMDAQELAEWQELRIIENKERRRWRRLN